MKKLIAILMVFGSFGAYAQGSIEGTVLDSLDDMQAAIGAHVWVEWGGQKIGSITDLDGKFRIKPLQPGTYELNVSFVGRGEIKIPGIVVKKDQIHRTKDIILGPMTIDVVTVHGWANDGVINFNQTGMSTIDSKEIMSSPLSKDIAGLATTMIGGIYQQDTGQPLYFRGGRSDAVKYIQDGMNVPQGISLPSIGIGEMSVFTGGVPAKYGDVMSGVIVVETKSYFDLYNQANR